MTPANAAATDTTTWPTPCSHGTVVHGRYRVLDRVGSGATAAVYRAEDLLLGRDVAH